MIPEINILLLGRSGAGKSTLANYLYRQDVFKTGEGSPVTEFGKPIEKASISMGKYNINIFDAPGLEPENYEKWNKEIDNFVQSHTCNNLDPSQLIHGSFYVINAGSKRIEPAELEIINGFPNKYHFPVSVVFTNCDAVEESDINALKSVLQDEVNDIDISLVCSVKKKKRGGKIVEPFGREELLSEHAEKVGFYFEKRMAIEYFGTIVPEALHRFFSETKSRIDNSDLNFITIIRDMDSALDNTIDFDDLESAIDDSPEVKKLFEYAEIVDMYIESITNRTSNLHNLLEGAFNIDFDRNMKKYAPDLKEIIDLDFDKLSVWETIKVLGQTAIFVLRIKSKLCEILDNIESDLKYKLLSEKRKCINDLTSHNAFQEYRSQH